MHWVPMMARQSGIHSDPMTVHHWESRWAHQSESRLEHHWEIRWEHQTVAKTGKHWVPMMVRQSGIHSDPMTVRH